MRPVLALALCLLCGCSSRLPNDRAAENDLRNVQWAHDKSTGDEAMPAPAPNTAGTLQVAGSAPTARKVARADPNYIAPEPARNDPSGERWEYPQHQAYHGEQRVTPKPERVGNKAESATEDHYTRARE